MMLADRLTQALADRYRIERELGQGGMATVYLAEDLKHGRKVALKVLKPELAAVIGAERFLREIKTIASLQHPHILGLIDSGEIDGTAFFVMPFVDGESLRDRLQREKQLPIADAVRLASEVASALDYAHRRGVIHRDIKPENILLHDGQALVADFGIALAMSSAGGTRMTETGMSLGTPTYMSPEQAMGEREITAKSDVYALGCVLYEMLVGEPPFTGPTAQAIVAKVMTDEPRPPIQLRKTVPPAVQQVALTALAKLPADRFATAAAVVDALANARFNTSGITAAIAAPSRAGRRRVGEAVALVALGAFVAIAALRPWNRAVVGASEARTQATFSGLATAPAISPDGRFLAYRETRCPEPPARGGCVQLQVLEVGGTRPVEVIAGAERLANPRWTHDGLAIVVGGALAEGRSGLFVVPRLGGIPRRIGDEPLAYDTHAAGDTAALVVARDSSAMLEIVHLATGQRVGDPVRVGTTTVDLAWSPDGQRFAVSSYDEVAILRRDGSLLAANREDGKRDIVRWSTDGREILTFMWTAGANDDFTAFPVDAKGRLGAGRRLVSQLPTLLAGTFDVARSTGRIVVGSGSEFSDIWSFDLAPGGVRSRRMTQGTSWHGPPTLSADGRILYFLRTDPLGNSLYSIVDGRETALTAEPQLVNNSLRLSLDQRLIAFESRLDSNPVLMIYDVASGATRTIPRELTDVGWLLPGGNQIVWRSHGTGSLWLTDAQGGRRDSLTTVEGAVEISGSYWFLAPDGKQIAVVGRTRDASVLTLVPLDGGPQTRLASFPLNEGVVGLAGWSRDGTLYLARGLGVFGGTTTLLGVDAATGARRPGFVLPTACDPLTVTYASAAGRAACIVPERRADLLLLDGIRQ